MDKSNLFLIGAAYAAVFWLVGWRWPTVVLAFTFSAGMVQTDIGGGSVKFSIAEINLGLLLVLCSAKCILEGRSMRLGPMAWSFAAYLSVCAASCFLTWRGGVAIITMAQMFLYFIVSVAVFSSLVKSPQELRAVLFTFAVAGAIWSVLGIVSHFHVLGHNKNGMGASFACVFLVTMELWLAEESNQSRSPIWRRYCLAGLLMVTTAGLLLAVSRGAWLGTLAGVILLMAMRRQFVSLIRILAVIVPILAISWNFLPENMQDYATSFDAKRNNIMLRYHSVDIAKAYFDENKVLGAGVGLRKTYDATNLLWITLAETGLLGMVTFLLIYVTFYRMIWTLSSRLRREDADYSLVAIATALMTNKFVHGMVDHYWSRGSISIVWASVGMAVCVYYAAPERRGTRVKTLLAGLEWLRTRRPELPAGPRPVARFEGYER